MVEKSKFLSELSDPIFNPPLSGKLIISGTWKCLAQSGKPGYGEKGVLTGSAMCVESFLSPMIAAILK